MKKTLIVIFSIIALFIICLFIFNKTAESTAKNDKQYVEKILANKIKPGMSPDEIDEFLKAFNTHLGLYECPEENQRGEDCVGERLLVAAIDLPGNHWILGKGTAQIYYSIGKNDLLEYHFYELYYPFYH